jgi:hypothetical protein
MKRTTDINLAAYLLYHDKRPDAVEVQGQQNKVAFFYDTEEAALIIADFYRDPSPMVDLRRYNHCRADVLTMSYNAKKEQKA